MSIDTNAAPEVAKAGLGSRLYNGETSIDFIGRQRRGLLLSALVIGLGLIAVVLQGLNFGIEFRGGTSQDVPPRNSMPKLRPWSRSATRPRPMTKAESRSPRRWRPMKSILVSPL